jgi:hypothetical protein
MVMRRGNFQLDSFIFAIAENKEVDDDDEPCGFSGKTGPVCQQCYLELVPEVWKVALRIACCSAIPHEDHT